MSCTYGTCGTCERCRAEGQVGGLVPPKAGTCRPAFSGAGTGAMRLVILESPYAPSKNGTIEENVNYARKCLRDCLLRGEAPIASHLLYTQAGVLNDTIPEERALGIEAGLRWGYFAQATVVYVDQGISSGMLEGISRAKREGRPVELRRLFGEASTWDANAAEGGDAGLVPTACPAESGKAG